MSVRLIDRWFSNAALIPLNHRPAAKLSAHTVDKVTPRSCRACQSYARRRLKVSVVICRECGVYSKSVHTHTWWSPDMVGTSDKPLFILHNYILNTNHRCLAMETCLAMQTCLGGIFWSGILTDPGERCSLQILERHTDDRYQLRPAFSFRSVLQSINISTDADMKICTPGQNVILVNYFSKCIEEIYFPLNYITCSLLCSEWVPSEWESKQLIKTSQ